MLTIDGCELRIPRDRPQADRSAVDASALRGRSSNVSCGKGMAYAEGVSSNGGPYTVAIACPRAGAHGN
eukprot:6079608-Prymnesium_polylepis.2